MNWRTKKSGDKRRKLRFALVPFTFRDRSYLFTLYWKHQTLRGDSYHYRLEWKTDERIPLWPKGGWVPDDL